jgi:hypothetical protein
MVLEDGQWSLYLFRFDEGREMRLSTVESPSAPSARYMSPNGRVLCWLAPANDEGCLLKTYDLKDDRVEDLGIDWPAGKDITWADCGWVDDGTLAVRGYSPSEPKRMVQEKPKALHILWVSYRDQTAAHTVSSRRFVKWSISPDTQHAFGAKEEGKDDSGVHYLDLRTGRHVAIGGQELPVWDTEGRHALRMSRFRGQGEWLCRFGVKESEETRLLEIAGDEELFAVSPRARFAIIRAKGHRLRPFSLVNVATRQRRQLTRSSMLAGLLGLLGGWRYHSPWISSFTPDERMFLLPSNAPPFGPRTYVVYLYSVPHEWWN